MIMFTYQSDTHSSYNLYQSKNSFFTMSINILKGIENMAS